MDSDDTSQQCVFVSHGRNSAWREVQAYIEKDLKLKTIELSQEPYSGRTNIQRLAEEADKCNYAVIVMTGDDSTPEGATRARENVIHEIGFFQGKYGFDRVCIVYQEGVSIPSNIDGLGRAQFKGADVGGAFVALAREIRQWLEKFDREKTIASQMPDIQNASTNKPLSEKKAKFKSVVLELEEEWIAERDGPSFSGESLH
jgi:predicted nucleotide-binding protein